MDQVKIRLFGSIFFGILWARHLSTFGAYNLPLLWIMEDLIFFGYFLAYLSRGFPVSTATGFLERYFPFLPAVLPFLLIYRMPDWNAIISLDPAQILRLAPITNVEYASFLQILIMVGTGLSVMGVLSLRTSFSIMSEARTLVTGGIYRYISHPMYLGQFLTYAGICAFHSSTYSWTLYGVFVGAQLLRMRVEEKKLQGAFQNYSEYRRSCWISL